MEINIESTHFDLSQKAKRKIEHKIELLRKFYQRITACDVIVSKQKNDEQKDYCVEAKILLPQNKLFVKEKAEYFDKALYQLVKKLSHQLKQYKDRQKEITHERL